MSGGRWVKEKNGDYQHYTDEEYNEKERSEGVVTSLGMVIGGAIFAYVAFTEEDFVFGDFGNGAFIVFCVSGLAALLGTFILINTSSISEIVNYLVFFGVIAGIIYFVFSCESDEKKEKKKTNTEKVTNASNSISILANTTLFKASKRNETV